MGSKDAATIALTYMLLTVWTGTSTAEETVPSDPSSVRVEYVHPENFIDVGDRYSSSDKIRAAYLEQLRKHIIRRAAPLLAKGQNLTVIVTEVDMAGGFEPWRRRLGDARIVRDVYPPRIDLSFRLTGADGVVIREGERKLRDLAFMTTTILYRNDRLRYEKALLDDWLEREFT